APRRFCRPDSTGPTRVPVRALRPWLVPPFRLSCANRFSARRARSSGMCTLTGRGRRGKGVYFIQLIQREGDVGGGLRGSNRGGQGERAGRSHQANRSVQGVGES